jgi:glycosyltransferase involved in cell wall biosynthesis
MRNESINALQVTNSPRFRFTIYTPCFNAESHIHRPFQSIIRQTFRDFEWLVIDDGSTDKTHSILHEFAKTANFPIQILTNEKNEHLDYCLERACKHARGELFVRLDSDDEMDPDSLDIFNRVWQEFRRPDVAAIWCHARTQKGHIIGKPFPNPIEISNYFSLYYPYLHGYEKFHCYDTNIIVDAMASYRSNHRYSLESSLWAKIAETHKTIFLDKALRTYFIEEANTNAITKASRAKHASATADLYQNWINKYLFRTNLPAWQRMRYHAALLLYSGLAKRSLSHVLRSTNRLRSRLLLLFLALPVQVLSLALSIAGALHRPTRRKA